MGQSSSAVVTSKVKPEKRDLIVDASDSCVTDVKLRSTGIIPISEYIKQEKCSKNIKTLETSYYKKNSIDKQPKENFKSKKVKKDFIETSYEVVPERRKWVRGNSKPNRSFEPDAVKIGIKNPSKTQTNDFPKYRRERSSERSSSDDSRENIVENNRNANREDNDVRDVVRPSTQKSNRFNIGTQEFNNKDVPRRNNRETEKKPIVANKLKKLNLRKITIEHKYKESATQTIIRDKDVSDENVRQLYKRQNYEEKQRNRNKYQDETKKEAIKTKQQYQQTQQQQQQQQQQQPKQKKVRDLRDFEEEKSTHQFQKHQISHHKRNSRNYQKNFTIETRLSCAIPPETYFQWQPCSNKNQLEKRVDRIKSNRKKAGGYCNRNDKFDPCVSNINSFNSSDIINSSESIMPSVSTIEQAYKEHRNFVSAKEALESWKNVHTWKQHKKSFQKSRNNYYQDNFDAATQTKSIVRKVSHQYLEKHHKIDSDMIMPSEKHLYKDFIMKMEHCLQGHSRLCELNAKRNGEGNFTWVQDKYRRWHKIIFDEVKN